MQFQVECFENVDAFSGKTSFISHTWTAGEVAEAFRDAPLRRVMNLRVEADTAEGSADEAFHIANAPDDDGSWEQGPPDLDGARWDHKRVRSMSSGDVVVVHTPDGPAAYGCLFMGWALLPPDMLPAGVTA